MSPWQVLRAGRASWAALGYRVHHGPGVLVHYSTTPATARDSSRSFCLSREKVALQDLNRRLASYLQQVQCLEAVNQKLERQIQEELDKKGPGELRELDTHLRTVYLLQHQISECLSAQAQVKLQLLSAELTSLDLSARYEKERERRVRLEAELSDLRLLGDELNVHKLPELQSLLNNQLQQLMELQIQHQQDMQGCPTQVSGVAVKMQTTGSSDLIQQLEDLRECVTLLNENQNECWFNTQVSMSACDSIAGSEVDQSELEDLRRTAASLEEELSQLQDLNAVLEASGLEQTESFVLQLEVLQQRADYLGREFDSVLQGTAQQAADYEALLYVKTKMQTEINDYKRLLDGMSQKSQSARRAVAEMATRLSLSVSLSLTGLIQPHLDVDQTQT
nr:keratin, type I cytoskeletal 18-like [Labrus bergylta]